MTDASDSETHSVERTRIEDYTFRLTEFSRPPSKGGNTRAQHRHALKIDGVWYSWFAHGGQKWVFVSDEVSFYWKWDSIRQYRNIVPGSVRTWDRTGDPVRRGNRGTKDKLHTASGRLPGRRSD